MKLQPSSEHPHGLSDPDFDALFTQNKPIIFAFHGYPWLIHRLTYRRTNHANLHVRGYKEEGTITTPFDMTVLNDLDRFHLVMDVIDRLPQTVVFRRAKQYADAKSRPSSRRNRFRFTMIAVCTPARNALRADPESRRGNCL
jgi:phosphoketolase